jgi:hypothetical protein
LGKGAIADALNSAVDEEAFGGEHASLW